MSETFDLSGNGNAFFNGEVLFRCEGSVNSRTVMPLVNLGQTILRRGEAIAPLQSMEKHYERLAAELAALRARIDEGYEAVKVMDEKIEADVMGFIPGLAPAAGPRDDAAFVREMAKASVWPHICVGEVKISLISTENEDELHEWLRDGEEKRPSGGRKGKKAAQAAQVPPPVDVDFDLNSTIVDPKKPADEAPEATESGSPAAEADKGVDDSVQVPADKQPAEEPSAVEPPTEAAPDVPSHAVADDEAPAVAEPESAPEVVEEAGAEAEEPGVEETGHDAEQPVEDAPAEATHAEPVPADASGAPETDHAALTPSDVLGMILHPDQPTSAPEAEAATAPEEGPEAGQETSTASGETESGAVPDADAPHGEVADEDAPQSSGLRPEFQALNEQLEDEDDAGAFPGPDETDSDDAEAPMLASGVSEIDDEDDDGFGGRGDGESEPEVDGGFPGDRPFIDGPTYSDSEALDASFGPVSSSKKSDGGMDSDAAPSGDGDGLGADWMTDSMMDEATPKSSDANADDATVAVEPTEPPAAPVVTPVPPPASRSALPPRAGLLPPRGSAPARRVVVSRVPKRDN